MVRFGPVPGARRVAALALFLLALGSVSAVHAEPHVRDGLRLGIGFGNGWAHVAWTDANPKTEPSGVVAGRVGWSARQDIALGLEFLGWSKGYEIRLLEGDVPVKAKLSGTTATVTYFPGNGGVLVAGGLGVAIASADFSPPAGVDFPVSGKSTETGVAAMAAMGYEFRVSRSLALGIEFDTRYLDVKSGGIDSAFVYGLTANFNWYW